MNRLTLHPIRRHAAQSTRASLFLMAAGLLSSLSLQHAQAAPSGYTIDTGNGQMVSLFSDIFTPPPSTIMAGSPTGPHLAKVWIYFIFWGSYWQPQNNPNQTPASIMTYNQSIVASPYLNEMSNYGFQRAYIGGNTTDPVDPTNGSWDPYAEVESLLQSPGRLPPPPDSTWQTLYVVELPPGTSGAVANHYQVSIPAGSTATMPLGTTARYTAAAALFNAGGFSHELVEAISDPIPGISLNQHLNWTSPDPAITDNEIADAGDLLVGAEPNGASVSVYWMNNLRADGLPQGLATEVAGSSMTSFFNTQVNMPDVFYMGSNTHINELYWNGGVWTSGDLMTQPYTSSAKPPVAPTALTSCCASGGAGDTHIFYTGTDFLVHELYRHNGMWFPGSITAADTNTVPILTGTRGLTSVINPVDGSIHVFYSLPGSDPLLSAQIWELYNPGPTGGWAQRQVSTLDTPSNDTQLTSVVDGSGFNRVFFIARNGHVEESYWNGQQWTGVDWTRQSGDTNVPGTTLSTGYPVQDGLTGYYDGAAIHIFYSGNDNWVHEISRNGGVTGQYFHYNVSSLSGDPYTAGAALTSYFDGLFGHVVNVALTNRVQNFYVIAGDLGPNNTYKESWSPYEDMTLATGAASPFASRLLTSVYDPVDQAQYVFYPVNDEKSSYAGDIGTFYAYPGSQYNWLSATLPYAGFTPMVAP